MVKSFSIGAIMLYGVLLSIELHAQISGELEWVKQMGGYRIDLGESIATDASGNIYTLGTFGGSSDFDPGAGEFRLIPKGSWDVFILKLDSIGNFLWAKQLGGSSLDVSFNFSVDSKGNVHSIGYFRGTADFDPGIGEFNLIAEGNSENDNDIFISKLDSSGNFLWAKQMMGVFGNYEYGIHVDPSGNVYATGRFSGTVDFDPGIDTFNLTVTGDRDIFILKLDSSGNFLWAKQIGGIGHDVGYGITADASGNVYTTGSFYGSVDFNPGIGTYNLTSTGDWDIFILKLDSSGNFIWAGQMGGGSEDVGYYISLDASDNVYISGEFFGTADFDPGPDNYDIVSSGGYDIFIAKLDPSGDFIWAKHLAGNSSEYGSNIYVDAPGNVYTTGSFSDPVDFDPSVRKYIFTPKGNWDIYVLKLDSDGDFVFAEQLGGTSNDRGKSITVDALDNIYITGSFNGLADFNPGIGTYDLTPTGDYDIFVNKMSQNYSSAIHDEIEILSFSFSNPPQKGDAVIDPASHTINIEIEQGADLTNLVTTYTLSAGATATVGGVFQESGVTINDFSTPVTYLITAGNGVTIQDWIVTVDQATGISENVINDINIYPNPSSTKLTIEFSNPNHSNYRLTIFNVAGLKVFEMDNITSEKIELGTGNFSTGLYIIELSGEKVFNNRMIFTK